MNAAKGGVADGAETALLRERFSDRSRADTGPLPLLHLAGELKEKPRSMALLMIRSNSRDGCKKKNNSAPFSRKGSDAFTDASNKTHMAGSCKQALPPVPEGRDVARIVFPARPRHRPQVRAH